MNKKIILLALGLSGMAALIYEIVWIRPLSLIFGSTIYATSTIIAAFLAGLSLGSWLFSKYADKIENPLKVFAFLELGIGVYGLLIISLFNILPSIYIGLYSVFSFSFSIFFLLQFLLSFVIVLIPTTLMGATWPLINKAYVNTEKVGKGTGSLYSVNNMGAVIGTLAAGFLLIPLLGIKLSIIFAATLNLIIAIGILIYQKRTKKKHIFSLILLFFLLALISSYNVNFLNSGFFIYASPEIGLDVFIEESERETLFYEEGLYGSVLVTSGNNFNSMRLSGKIQCSSERAAVDNLRRISVIPLDIFEENYKTPPNNALNLGLGCGITSGHLISEGIPTTTIEIDSTVVEASDYFKNVNNHVIENKNHKLVINDARNWLILNDEKFDVITLQPADPWVDRSANLFSQEFFILLESHLTERGVASQWVPIFEMNLEDFKIFYNTFHSAFPYVYVYKMKPNSIELLFVGSKKPLEIKESFFYLLSNEQIPEFDTALNTDDKPILEFSTAKNIYNENPTPILEKIDEWRNIK